MGNEMDTSEQKWNYSWLLETGSHTSTMSVYVRKVGEISKLILSLTGQPLCLMRECMCMCVHMYHGIGQTNEIVSD